MSSRSRRPQSGGRGRWRVRLFGGPLAVVALMATLPIQLTGQVSEAAMRGDIDAVRAALASGGDVNQATPDGMTALHWAAERGDAALASLLLEAGADPSAETRLGGYLPLHLAATAGDATAVRVLLEGGADPNRATTAGGASPLHFAARTGDAETVSALLAAGADPNATERAQGQTPLMFAAAADRVDAIRALIVGGAQVRAMSYVVDVEARSTAIREQRQTRGGTGGGRGGSAGDGTDAGGGADAGLPGALPGASIGARLPLSDASSAAEADSAGGSRSYSNLVGHIGGLTPLLHAAREGHREAVRTLIEAGAPIDQVSGGDRTSPMLISAINGHFDLVLDLLRAGADPQLASEAGATPLYAVLNIHWAPKARFPQPGAQKQQEAGYLETMSALLEAGADPNARLDRHLWYMGYNFDLLRVDTSGATPFWRAAYATDVEAMRLLFAHGADPTLGTVRAGGGGGRGGTSGALDPSGLPPLAPGATAVHPIHAASGVGYGEGYAGNAHRHVPEGWIPAVRYLVEERAADVNARDQNGYTPLHHAAARGDNELILYLVEQGADVTAVSRRGQTTVDMANGPVQRITPFPATIALLEKLGAKNNHNCVGC